MSKIIPARHVQTARHGWHLLRNRKTLWQMLREVWTGTYRMSLLTTLTVILLLAYIIFPFDFIPDYIPFIGWIDDGIVAYLMLRMLVKETQRYSRLKAMKRKQG